ncbi:MAG TPA: GNAT family N-acetyltransferase [Opitutaceae bacterium]|nr:GNAT family N-acetyltransferase [Opitutaceae bacterium]
MPRIVSIEHLSVGPVVVTMRPRQPADEPLLLRIYASTRAEEMARLPWTAAEKHRFLQMQFEAQDRAYQGNYPDADCTILLVGGRAAGRLYLHETEESCRVVDISLLPEYRGRGIGAAILREVQRQASAAGRRVTLFVEAHNPARRLYERLGFQSTGVVDGTHLGMEWRSVPTGG